MSSISCVTVLCPNGHRQSVKVTPNTKLLHVLEEVCLKQGFDPGVHVLRKEDVKRSVFDVTLTVRFAGLTNNARLELVASGQSKKEESVTIALQLDGGHRLQGSFQPSTSLWEVVVHFDEILRDIPSSEHTLVLVYMREEVTGKIAMQYTTIRDLGLTRGSAVFRVIWRKVEMTVLQDIEDAVKRKYEERALLMRNQKGKVEKQEEEKLVEVAQHKDETQYEKQSKQQAQEEKQEENMTVMELEQDSSDGKNMLDMVAGSDHVSSLADLGYGCDEPMQVDDVAGVKQAPDCGASTSRLQPSGFTDFHFPESSAGCDFTQQNVCAGGDSEPCDRHAQVYYMDQATLAYTSDVGDDFFTVTAQDVRNMQSHLTAELRRLEDAPLLTKAQKEAKVQAQISKYGHSTIRFRLPGQYVLQARFRPRETVSVLKEFVAQALAEPRPHFYLYTPPKTLLSNENQPLLHYHLFPNATVVVGSKEANRLELRADLLSTAISLSSQDPVLTGSRTGTGSEEGGEKVKREGNTPTNSTTTGAAPSQNTKGNVPKWFKVGK